MGWATQHIENLKKGQTVTFRPRGSSLKGKVESGQLCTVEPLSGTLDKGDIVLCKIKGREFLHLISAIQGNRYQISNNRGHINGWVSLNGIFGILTRIEP